MGRGRGVEGGFPGTWSCDLSTVEYGLLLFTLCKINLDFLFNIILVGCKEDVHFPL